MKFISSLTLLIVLVLIVPLYWGIVICIDLIETPAIYFWTVFVREFFQDLFQDNTTKVVISWIISVLPNVNEARFIELLKEITYSTAKKLFQDNHGDFSKADFWNFNLALVVPLVGLFPLIYSSYEQKKKHSEEVKSMRLSILGEMLQNIRLVNMPEHEVLPRTSVFESLRLRRDLVKSLEDFVQIEAFYHSCYILLDVVGNSPYPNKYALMRREKIKLLTAFRIFLARNCDHNFNYKEASDRFLNATSHVTFLRLTLEEYTSMYKDITPKGLRDKIDGLGTTLMSGFKSDDPLLPVIIKYLKAQIEVKLENEQVLMTQHKLADDPFSWQFEDWLKVRQLRELLFEPDFIAKLVGKIDEELLDIQYNELNFQISTSKSGLESLIDRAIG